jgi:hypothetical protein
MAIDQADRPSADEVLTETQANLDKWKLDARSMTPAQRQNDLRVYYKGTEINDMSVGPANLDHTLQQLGSLMDDKFADPEDLPLNPPDEVFGLHKVAYLGRKCNALDRGYGGPFRMRRVADGQIEFLPPGNDAPVVDDTPMNLPFDHEHIQRVRRYINNRARQPPQARDDDDEFDIDTRIARDLRDRSKGLRLSAEDIAIIRVLQRFYGRRLGGSSAANDSRTDLTPVPQFDPLVELPPSATRAWRDFEVTDLGGTESILFLHDPTAPEELRPLAEAVEKFVRSALATAKAKRRRAARFNRGIIQRGIIEFLELVQAAYVTEDVAELPADRVSRLKDFIQDLRRRHRGMRSSDRERVGAVDPQDITDELAKLSVRVHDLVDYVDPDLIQTGNLNLAQTNNQDPNGVNRPDRSGNVNSNGNGTDKHDLTGINAGKSRNSAQEVATTVQRTGNQEGQQEEGQEGGGAGGALVEGGQGLAEAGEAPVDGGADPVEGEGEGAGNDGNDAPQPPAILPGANAAPLPVPVKGGPRLLANGTMGKYCKHPCFTGFSTVTGIQCLHIKCCRNGMEA